MPKILIVVVQPKIAFRFGAGDDGGAGGIAPMFLLSITMRRH